MPRIYKPNQGPSVALREAQRGGDPGFIQAPNNTAQIDALGRQSQGYMQSYQNQANRNAEFQQNTLARAQRAQESNAQLALQQMQSRQSMELKADGIRSDTLLGNMRLQMGQQETANNIALDQRRTENLQLTELGNSFIRFSQTLWQKKAEQINKENEELRLQGLIDYQNGVTGNVQADIAKVNQAEILRTQGSANAEAAAVQFEQAGQKADATLIRASNPFYLRGQQEGQAIKAGVGYPSYLQTKVRQALDSGELVRTKASYQDELKLLINTASKEYIKENGLAGINPGVLAKYFGYTRAQTEAQVLETYVNDSYKAVKETQRAIADSTVYNSAAAIRSLPANQRTGEFIKLVSLATSAYNDPIKGTEVAIKQLIKEAVSSENFDVVDAFIRSDRGNGDAFGNSPGILEIYDEAKRTFNRQQAARLEQVRDQQLEAIQADFDRVFATGDVNSIREAQDSTVARLMQLGTPEAMAKARQIATTNPGESPLIQESLRRAEDGGYLDRFLRDNRDRMTASTYEKYAKRAEQTSKLKEPAYKQALDQTLNMIKFSAGEANERREKMIKPHSTQALNDYVKIQQDKLRQYAREWLAQNPGSNPKDFQDWLKSQEKGYTDLRQFVIDDQSDLPRGMQTSRSGSPEFTGNPLVRREKYNGEFIEDYRHPDVVRGLAAGTISGAAINFNKDLVFSDKRVEEAINNYEKNGTWPNDMVQIASRTGRTVKSMMQAQARRHNFSGVIMDPGNFKLPPSPSGNGRVSMDAVRTFGQSFGMSEQGAKTFATMVQDESGGDPVVSGDNGAAQGLMQWNRVGSPDRVRRLQQFAQQRGKPVTDPGTQLNYAIYEMKNFYPSVWSVLTSRNPTNNQLWRASVEYLGFNPRVYAQRKASLEANLR